jgi:hypothetical protein
MYSGNLASFCLCVKFIHRIRFILSIKRVHGDVTIQKIAMTIRTKRTAQLTNVQPIIGSGSQVIANVIGKYKYFLNIEKCFV